MALLSYKSQPPILPVRCEKMRVAREMLPRDERHRKEKAKAKASGAETKTAREVAAVVTQGAFISPR